MGKNNTKISASVYLCSDVVAFNMSKILFKKLSTAFPQINFEYCQNSDDFKESLKNADIVITWIFKEEWYDLAPHLKGIFTPAAGYDWIASAPDNKIKIFHGTFHGLIIREALLGMILYNLRKQEKADKNQQLKKWDRNYGSPSRILRGQKVLILGCGNIGLCCAKLFLFLGCSVVGVVRKKKKNRFQADGLSIITLNEMNSCLPTVDHLITLLPKTPGTDNIIKKKHFQLLKKTAFFYNLGRGNCIDENVLVEALDNKELAGASLDVFGQEPLPISSPLWEHPQMKITPHSSCIIEEYMALYIEELIEKIKDLIQATLF
ncbi:MAG: NAD(P)-dependent oxidoreductase [Verrucomicrobiota bacterium]|nr:NAD(P)-dependent oxidoreductase [Verrucomicrobiota bacterium]